jgi:hypothetical protein
MFSSTMPNLNSALLPKTVMFTPRFRQKRTRQCKNVLLRRQRQVKLGIFGDSTKQSCLLLAITPSDQNL